MSKERKMICVKDVMTPEVKTIDGLATVAEAIQTMKDKKYGALIVAKRDEDDEYGFITVQDIAKNVIEKNLSPERVHVYEIMNKPVLSMRADMNIRYAIRLLEQIDHGRALVIENRRAVGIVTMYDMVIHYMDTNLQ
ncbi:MAG: CBS domain-containing protein [Alphaproteobacteria bacterium]|nr:CBS domain-containing protein [Alphaproteobacteria bacterium]